MIDFFNTNIAFSYRSNIALKKALFLFQAVKYPFWVKLITKITFFAQGLKFPIHYFIKPFMFSHFCGGENLIEALKTAKILEKFKVYSILDFAVEGLTDDKSVNNVVLEIRQTIEVASNNPAIAFSVFKPTALASASILERINNTKDLTEVEKEEKNKFEMRFNSLCEFAYKNEVKLLIDAEEVCYQDYIDALCEEAMMKYNKNSTIIYTTLQMYRNDRLEYLNQLIRKAKELNFYLGVKLVRGAYMEKERALAVENGVASPIHNTKSETDNAYNSAIKLIFENISHSSLFVGTHNEESIQLTVNLMQEFGLKPDDSRIFLAQLFGMSDQITFNAASMGYNVAKYVPYGPVKVTIPYLLRRAQENTSVAGQTTRELELVKKEIRRRKKEARI